MTESREKSDGATPVIEPARLQWRGDQPFSPRFGDIYHAPDGAAEVERVFIAPNRLSERFAATDTPVFRVGEIGFGTGLNFVVIAQRFIERAPADARLHFVTFDAHPLTHADFCTMAQRRCAALPLYRELARRYPPTLSGWHRRSLCEGRVVLSVFFGDASSGLVDLAAHAAPPVDAWLLDGFAPDRNPALWSELVLGHVAALSGPSTTVATFTSAGRVRRQLADFGFSMQRVEQLPHKRHSLCGEFSSRAVARRSGLSGATREPPRAPAMVDVLGAGLAGCATARALASWGIRVRLIERASVPQNALRGSVLHTRLHGGSRIDAWQNRAFFHATNVLADVRGFNRTGVLQAANETFPQTRLLGIANDVRALPGVELVDAVTASSLAGIPLHEAALYFRDAGSIDLVTLCETLADHPAIERVADDTTDDRYPLVICTGAHARAVPGLEFLELASVRGQIDVFEMRGGPAVPLIGDGFVTPLGEHTFAVGATYEHRPWDAARATTFNRERAERFIARVTAAGPPVLRPRGSMRGVRAVTSDRLPVIGRVEIPERRNAVYLNVGHGSSGTITAPFGAACIAAILAGDFAPLEANALAGLGAGRFIERQRRRGPRHGAFGVTRIRAS